MKTCKPFEKQLTAYLVSELNETEFQKFEAHLESCEACRAELAAQRTTLELMGEALEAAPAPEKLVAWRDIPKRPSVHRSTVRDYWYSPGFRAGLVTAAACSLFVFLSLSYVAVSVIQKEEPRFDAESVAEHDVVIGQEFTAAPVARPKQKLKKLEVPSTEPKPKLRKQIAYSASPAPVAVSTSSVERYGSALADSSGMAYGGGQTVAGTMVLSESVVADHYGYVTPMIIDTEFNTEQYDRTVDNAFNMALDNPLSTFSIDVDRAAYANVRRFLADNQLPPPDAVRIEEMVNYFNYDYPQPEGEDPFHVSLEVADCPWDNEHQLALVGLQGLEIETKDLPPNNLVFLLDVSGSMNRANKLPLLKSSMRLLVGQLRPEDRVSIVVYAGAAGIVLKPTADKAAILEAINRLNAGGSTAGGAGIELAYKTAQENFAEEGNNRVILATDGDFNVGMSSDGALTRLIEEKRETGIFLTVLGFGTGNYKDSKMEKLADKGNGNYAYIDDILEAKKVLVNEMGGTLVTIAKDVKVQIEFNPAQVMAYRLIGYENRMLAAQDFADDRKDAGELGAGHTVTALYELIPAGSDEPIPMAGDLKYQKTRLSKSNELMTVKLRYKQPDGETSKLLTRAVLAEDIQNDEESDNLRFASAVAEFGMLLRGSEYKGNATYEDVLQRAKGARGLDEEGYRAEFIRLVEKAELLSPPE